MAGSATKFTLFLILTVWVMLACQITDSLDLTGSTPTPSGPRSTFVPHPEKLVVDLEEQAMIETYHLSENRFGSLEIFVNRLPVPENYSTLTSVEIATLKVLAPTTEYADGVCVDEGDCAELGTITVSITDQPIVVPPIQSKYPNTTWRVYLMWTGHVPGTYDLTLQVTDNAGKQGERLTQRIEVKEATP